MTDKPQLLTSVLPPCARAPIVGTVDILAISIIEFRPIRSLMLVTLGEGEPSHVISHGSDGDIFKSMYHRYLNRAEAGRVIADLVARHPLQGKAIVVALPRGGVPIGYEVAKKLGAPLDLLVVRKIGAPGNAELACGAFILGGEVVWNTKVMKALRVTRQDLEDTYQDEVDEAKRREEALRTPESPPVPLAGSSVIIVDDGLATGATMKAAIQGVKGEGVREIIVAVPVGPVSTCREIEEMECSLIVDQRIDEVGFSSVGEWYQHFPQVSTEECREIVVSNRREVFRANREEGQAPLSSL